MINYDGESVDINSKMESGSYHLYLVPSVSCKYWIIANNESGDILFSYNKDKQVGPASLTKVFLVLFK